MEIVKGSIKYYPAKRIRMWNLRLPFNRGLHLEVNIPNIELGVYNWKTCLYSMLFRVEELKRLDGVFREVSFLGWIRYFRGFHPYRHQDLVKVIS